MNRLGSETSPYLRQHADNPVHWWPWTEAAFADARSTDRPVLLSVGYSACHWCHVMAHESFETEATAAVMNEHFVNIKVDREERPDVDAIYMEAVQAITGRGGWPMTVFLTPAGEPFFGGTYFPDVGRGAMPSFVQLLDRVHEVWTNQRDEVETQARQLTAGLQRAALLEPSPDTAEADLFEPLVRTLLRAYDPERGGFGQAPKFPQTMGLDALLRAHRRTPDPDVLAVVSDSLDAMAAGGIYDHLGGGFCRYSVDDTWTVPHFEKMLYDNALMTRVYLHAWQVTGEPRLLQVVDETIAYVLRDLRDPTGGFYSAEDADSEGVEGKFYVWTPDQIHAVLAGDAPEFSAWYGVTAEGNFEGRNILWRPARGDLRRSANLEFSRQRLFQAREMRIRPGLDDKVLAEWNGLMVSSLAEAALVTGNQQWLGAALKAGTFLADHLRREDGRWLRSWQAGDEDRAAEAKHLAYAADLAALIDAFTRLAEASGQAKWIGLATDTADQLLHLFWDAERGGVFSTGSDAPALITRPKDVTDNAVPGANSAAAVSLLRLAALTGNNRYRDHAKRIVALLAPLAADHPASFGHLIAAWDMLTDGMTEIVIPGHNEELVDVLRLTYRPNSVLAWGDPYPSPLWEGRDRGAAYVCHNFTCALPATTPESLAAQLSDI